MGRRRRTPRTPAQTNLSAAQAAVRGMAGRLPTLAAAHDPAGVVTGVVLVTRLRGADGWEYTMLAVDVDTPVGDQAAYLVDTLERAVKVASDPDTIDQALADASERAGHNRAA